MNNIIVLDCLICNKSLKGYYIQRCDNDNCRSFIVQFSGLSGKMLYYSFSINGWKFSSDFANKKSTLSEVKTYNNKIVIDEITPFPSSKDDAIKIIDRILNLKAFS